MTRERDDKAPPPAWHDDLEADAAGRLAGGTAGRASAPLEYLSAAKIAADHGVDAGEVEAAIASGALATDSVFGKRYARKPSVIAWLAAGRPSSAPPANATPPITATLASSSRPRSSDAAAFASAAEQLGLDADEVVGARDVAANRRSAPTPTSYEAPPYETPSYEAPADEASVLASVAEQLELDPTELVTNNRTIAGRRRVPV